jgi:hypothetical protein
MNVEYGGRSPAHAKTSASRSLRVLDHDLGLMALCRFT